MGIPDPNWLSNYGIPLPANLVNFLESPCNPAGLLLHIAMNWSIWLAMPKMKMDLLISSFLIGFLAAAVLIVIKIWGAEQLKGGEMG